MAMFTHADRDNIKRQLRNNLLHETNLNDEGPQQNSEENSYLTGGDRTAVTRRFLKQQNSNMNNVDNEKQQHELLVEIVNDVTLYMERKTRCSHKLDRCCRIVYPCSFLILNIIYFIFHYIMYNEPDK